MACVKFVGRCNQSRHDAQMAKRKREDETYEPSPHTRPRRKVQQGTVDAAVSQSRKLLHRALKLAKGFERQKLSRRLKNAQTDMDEEGVNRIKADIEAWKVSRQFS